ncbi:hypothetical protein [Massilia consociata]|uniref:Uncharacterized protein n=1 Tax=Massilia consociata TaxID=760117 RepID=A0ABV6FEK0_9BURK
MYKRIFPPKGGTDATRRPVAAGVAPAKFPGADARKVLARTGTPVPVHR